jgi:hypothetical protein
MRNKAMKWSKLFIYSAGGILLAAALVRFIIAVENAQFLSLLEPLLGIPLRIAVLLVGTIELIAALFCLFGRQVNLQLALLMWLATNYVVYWVGRFWVPGQLQGTCLGSLTDPLHLSRGMPGIITGCIPVYLLLGGCMAMLGLWLEERRAQTAKFMRMSCPACGIHLRFDELNLGQKIPCPHCQNPITLRKPNLLKMACFFCQEHIEFPAHAIGEKMPCPHCKMDITLKEPA